MKNKSLGLEAMESRVARKSTANPAQATLQKKNL
jgi:hypothetical protein